MLLKCIFLRASPLEVLAFLLHFPLLKNKDFCAYQVPLKVGKLPIVTPKNVKRAHKQEKAVHVWTVNDKQTMSALLKMGVDGIVTDKPDLLLETLNS
ncbi:MAG: glycerophosphodiester phosphodiesterase family protein [Candidatus Heimdallarchaeaceae archaeon]